MASATMQLTYLIAQAALVVIRNTHAAILPFSSSHSNIMARALRTLQSSLHEFCQKITGVVGVQQATEGLCFEKSCSSPNFTVIELGSPVSDELAMLFMFIEGLKANNQMYVLSEQPQFLSEAEKIAEWANIA